MATSHANKLEYEQRVVFPKAVVIEAMALCKEFGPDYPQPSTIVNLLTSAAEQTNNGATENSLQLRYEQEKLDNLFYLKKEDARRRNHSDPGYQDDLAKAIEEITTCKSLIGTLSKGSLAQQNRAKEKEMYALWEELGTLGWPDTRIAPEEHADGADQTELRNKWYRADQLRKQIQKFNQGRSSPSKVLIHHLQVAAERMFGTRILPATQEEIARLDRLLPLISDKIIGQAKALEPIISALYRVGIQERRTQPMSCFLLVGPPSTGKTSTGQTIAEIAYGDGNACKIINCSRYIQDHSMEELTGNSQGKRGDLVDYIQKYPRCVIVFDELDKGGPAIQLLLQSITGYGYLEVMGTGHKVSCRSVFVLATTNIGQARIDTVKPGQPISWEARLAIENDCRKEFRPEVMSRFSGVSIYTHLSLETVIKITRKTLSRHCNDLSRKIGLEISVSANARTHLFAIAAKTMEDDQRPDGRQVLRVVNEELEKSISIPIYRKRSALTPTYAIILTWMGTGVSSKPEDVEDGGFLVVAQDKQSGTSFTL